MTQHTTHGFFAAVPRIIRTQYKHLTTSEKWLYTCLKDLCGDKGTCFRAMRTLAEETGLSLASLSSMIPNLHKAGLIHAEKKPRGLGGKEVWHISIVDIWQANATYCSTSEQLTKSIVQPVNNSQPVVQNLNEEAEYCSTSERSCSNFDDRRRLPEEEKIEEDRPLRADEQHTDALSIPTLSLRDDESDIQSSYSHEPAESEWLCEIGGETDIFEEDADPTEKRPIVSQGGNLAPGERRARSESKDRREGSNEHPAVKPPTLGPPPASPGQAAQLREQPTIQSTSAAKPRQPTETPTGDTPDASTLPTKKTDGKGNRKKSEVPLLCDTRTIHKLIDAERGWSKEERGARINENIVIKEWCQHHPLEHYHIVVRYLKTRDPFWSKENRVHKFFSADKLAEQTPRVLAELGLVPKPELPPDIPMPAASSPPNGKYHPYTRASMYDPIEIGV